MKLFKKRSNKIKLFFTNIFKNFKIWGGSVKGKVFFKRNSKNNQIINF